MTVTIRDVRKSDGRALAAANQASRDLHHPWVEPFRDLPGFKAWFGAIAQGRRRSFVVEADGVLAGVINLNEIVRGVFQSAYLGYYALHSANRAGGTGQGTMTRALALVIAEAFGLMGLHRLEANIQPGNTRSKALVQRLGFRLEGFSPHYLHIAGAWRDHERWAIRTDDDVASQQETR